MRSFFYILRKTFILVLLCSSHILSAQSVGVNTSSPNSNAALDVVSTNKGVLIPRVSLSSSTSASPLGAFVAGMMVYNTATAGDVTPGFYLCNGTKWEKAGGGWNLTGNSGTNPTTNFIGTTDNQDMVFKINNTRAGLLSNTSANTSFGINALNVANTGGGNNAFGGGTLFKNTSGAANIGMGVQALFENTVGDVNIGIGYQALGNNKAGNGGIAIGSQAMYNINNSSTPFENTNIAIGNSALLGSNAPINNTGLHNIVMGNQSLKNNTSGNYNNTLGNEALFNNTSGSSNIGIGYRTLYYNTNKSELIAIGDSALHNNGVGATFVLHSINNTAIGTKALKENTTGYYNTAIGHHSLMKNTIGLYNTAVGNAALKDNVTGYDNTAFGAESLTKNLSYGNSSFGVQSLPLLTSGYNNTAIGVRAGLSNITGSGNIFIGSEAGYHETGSNKLYIENSSANELNALIYGEFDNDKVQINNKLGIGRPSSGFPLEIRGDAFNGFIKFYNNIGSPKWHMRLESDGGLGLTETNVADKRFVVKPGGQVTIGDKAATGYLLSVKGKIATEEVLVDLNTGWPDYVFTKDYPLKSLEDVKLFIEKNGHLPNVPSAKEVEDNGLLLGNMNKILMEKVEELTLYILKQEEAMRKMEVRLKKVEEQQVMLQATGSRSSN